MKSSSGKNYHQLRQGGGYNALPERERPRQSMIGVTKTNNGLKNKRAPLRLMLLLVTSVHLGSLASVNIITKIITIMEIFNIYWLWGSPVHHRVHPWLNPWLHLTSQKCSHFTNRMNILGFGM